MKRLRVIAGVDEPMPYARDGSHAPWLEREVRQVGKGAAILELGAGNTSTPLLRRLTDEIGQSWFTVEPASEWRPPKFHAAHFVYVRAEDIPPRQCFDVALVDSAPASERVPLAISLMGRVRTFVLHDTELEHDASYRWTPLWDYLRASGWQLERHTCKWTQIETTIARQA